MQSAVIERKKIGITTTRGWTSEAVLYISLVSVLRVVMHDLLNENGPRASSEESRHSCCKEKALAMIGTFFFKSN